MNKVGDNHTFWVKTLIDMHKCGKVFGNKNANKDWMSKVLMNKFRNFGKMTTNKIIDDIKKLYNIGITTWGALQAKEMAMEIL